VYDVVVKKFTFAISSAAHSLLLQCILLRVSKVLVNIVGRLVYIITVNNI